MIKQQLTAASYIEDLQTALSATQPEEMDVTLRRMITQIGDVIRRFILKGIPGPPFLQTGSAQADCWEFSHLLEFYEKPVCYESSLTQMEMARENTRIASMALFAIEQIAKAPDMARSFRSLMRLIDALQTLRNGDYDAVEWTIAQQLQSELRETFRETSRETKRETLSRRELS